MNKDDIYDEVISRFNYLYHTDLKDDQVNNTISDIVDCVDNFVNNLISKEDY